MAEACLANTRLLAQSPALKRKKNVFIKQSISEDMSGNVVGPADNKDKKLRLLPRTACN